MRDFIHHCSQSRSSFILSTLYTRLRWGKLIYLRVIFADRELIFYILLTDASGYYIKFNLFSPDFHEVKGIMMSAQVNCKNWVSLNIQNKFDWPVVFDRVSIFLSLDAIFYLQDVLSKLFLQHLLLLNISSDGKWVFQYYFQYQTNN